MAHKPHFTDEQKRQLIAEFYALPRLGGRVASGYTLELAIQWNVSTTYIRALAKSAEWEEGMPPLNGRRGAPGVTGPRV